MFHVLLILTLIGLFLSYSLNREHFESPPFFSSIVRPEQPSFPFLTDPQLHEGDRFYLKTLNGEYISVCSDCQPKDQNLTNKCSSVLCLKKYPTRGSVFVYVPYRDGTFSVQSDLTGKFWKRCNNCVHLCSDIICSDAINPRLQPAKFVLIKLGDTISIKTDTGRLLDVMECEQTCGRVVAAVSTGVDWNKGHYQTGQFTIEKLPRIPAPIVEDRSPTKKIIVPSYAAISLQAYVT
jgi:hypothetical protein